MSRKGKILFIISVIFMIALLVGASAASFFVPNANLISLIAYCIAEVSFTVLVFGIFGMRIFKYIYLVFVAAFVIMSTAFAIAAIMQMDIIFALIMLAISVLLVLTLIPVVFKKM